MRALDERAQPPAVRKPIRRLLAGDVTEQVLAGFFARREPLVIEGFMEHAGMAPLNTTLLRRLCGDRRVKFSQRRLHFLQMLSGMLGEGAARWLVDAHLYWGFGTSLERVLAKFAETPALAAVLDA